MRAAELAAPVARRGCLKKGEFHDLLVGFPCADDAVMRADGGGSGIFIGVPLILVQ